MPHLSLATHESADAPRSMLFVSGEMSERFDKACTAGADLVCIDFEHAVRSEVKQKAREQVFAYARAHQGRALAVRLTRLRSAEGLQDIVALLPSKTVFDCLLLPKVEHADDMSLVHDWAAGCFRRLVGIIESPPGVENAHAIASSAHRGAPKVSALMLGGADLSVELGCEFRWDGLLHARTRLVNAARASGLEAWGVPHLDLADVDGLREETRRAVGLGFTRKTAIHPRRVAPNDEAFVPDAAELQWARDLLSSDGAREDDAFIFKGKLVDAPVLAKAWRLVRRAS